ncbi:hypothetical protein [Planobispora takensis]|uniref:Serine protease n=1 Tax=Planobispora takensis TaxID=1367882 RepID=A0A8J3WUF7_9ACTN|nr:hypothetical protein [Planobispora takensis]GII02621.1 hypothetical protein Pta02_46290 [Planobispora takensis]
MNPRAKHLLIPLTVAGLSAAALASPAQATAPEFDRENLTAGAPGAYAIAKFWLDANGAALKKATQYNWDSKEVTKLVATQGDTSDGKAGSVAPTGGKSGPSAKVKNVNLPRTIGKVFFLDHKGQPRWCSGTSIQSRYLNLVSTAGHCAYDVEGNKEVVSNWVFVPGYYQGKAPWGLYVGQAAFTHYNFSVHEDFDHDYAFVAVYNGFVLNGEKVVTGAEFADWKGGKWIEPKEITADEYAAGVSKYGPLGPYKKEDKVAKDVQTVNPPADRSDPKYLTEEGKGGVRLLAVEVTSYDYGKAPVASSAYANNERYESKSGDKGKTPISKEEYDKLVKEKAAGNFLGQLTTVKDKNDTEIEWYKTQYFIKKWVKTDVTTTTYYWVEKYVIGLAKETGRLGEVVGGQGFAWNQKIGQPVFAFGYPAAPHPDGDKPYTGLTPKYCYGKTNTSTYAVNDYKVEDQIALRCSMTPGADGGPWILKYNNAKRLGFVNGVTSLFHDQDGNERIDFVSSPYFDGDAAGVYNEANVVRNTRIVSDKGELLR